MDELKLLQTVVHLPPPQTHTHPLSSRDVRRFKEVRKEFERGSECLEGAQMKNAQVPRGKQHEVEEASNALLNARKAFRSEALDYVLQVRRQKAFTGANAWFALPTEQTSCRLSLFVPKVAAFGLSCALMLTTVSTCCRLVVVALRCFTVQRVVSSVMVACL